MARKLSRFNLFMRQKMRAGSSFIGAVRAWRGRGKGNKTKTEGQVMARRTRRRARTYARPARRSRGGRRGGMGFGGIGGIPNTVMRAGEAYAVGAGTKMMLDGLSNITGFQMLKPYTGYIGAFMAYKKAGGLPGIVSAVPLALQSTNMSGSSSSGNAIVL